MTFVPSTTVQLREQLMSAGHEDLVIFSPDGTIVEREGVFKDDDARCNAAHAALQSTSMVLKGGEKLKRITVTFDDAIFVGTVATIASKPFGVFIRRDPRTQN